MAVVPLWKKKYKCPVGRPAGSPFFIMNQLDSERFSISRLLFAVSSILCIASACSPASTPTPFRPPTLQAPLIEPTFIIHPTQEIVVIQPTPLPTIFPTINPANCSNNLTFVEDLTIPDNMFTTFGLALDKQWLIQNSGTCNWSS